MILSLKLASVSCIPYWLRRSEQMAVMLEPRR